MEQQYSDNLKLTKSLFWDVDPETIDFQKHASYVIERVISRGTLNDFKTMVNFYGKPKIKRIIKDIRHLDDRVLNFCSAYFDIPLTDFRCYNTKQSNTVHWNY
jgi:phage host-nuclease inhibitor protein Gam